MTIKILYDKINDMFGIVVALKKEAQFFLEKFNCTKGQKISDKPLYKGNIHGEDFVLVVSGIGKVSASISAQALIDRYSPKFILNFGTAGGVLPNIEIGEYLLINNALQFDFDVTAIDDVEVGYIQEYDRAFFPCENIECQLKKVNLASGDRFSDDVKDIELIKKLNCALRDMEGGAIAQTCLSNSVPLVMVKAVTDVYGKTPSNFQFYENLIKLCEGFPSVLENVLKESIKKFL